MSGGEHEGGEGEHEESLWGKMLGWGSAAMHTVGAGAELAIHSRVGQMAEHLVESGFSEAEEAEHLAESMIPGASGVGESVLGKVLPGIGTAIGVGQFGYHAHEAANTEDNGQYTNNEHWNHVGEATLGAAGAAASWCPPAALYLGAGELAVDGLGGLAGMINPDWGFSAGSVVGQAEHMAGNLSMENHPVINTMMSACPLTAPIAAAANMGSLVTGAGNLLDSSGVSGAVGGAYNAVADW